MISLSFPWQNLFLYLGALVWLVIPFLCTGKDDRYGMGFMFGLFIAGPIVFVFFLCAYLASKLYL